MSTQSGEAPRTQLSGLRVALVGKLAGMNWREASQLIRRHGGTPVEVDANPVHLLVVGEADLPLDESVDHCVSDAARQAADQGRLEIISETQLWQRLGLLENEQNIHRLYTPAILAELVGVPVSVIRRWHRRGLIVPAREVRRLPYFDFQEVAAARRLAEMLAAGVKPKDLERKLAELARFLPHIERPLAQLSIIVEGKELLLREGGGLLASGGQRWFDFDAPAPSSPAPPEPEPTSTLRMPPRNADASDKADLDRMLDAAAELEDAGQLDQAADMYRAAMAAAGPQPETCFLLAELLYRMGDLPAARERYYMAVELDDNYVEARANLGCVLHETGQHDLALAAFEGALAYHAEYPDAHYHLARMLDELGRSQEAAPHWQAFVDLVPESPWAAEAQSRLQENSVAGS